MLLIHCLTVAVRIESYKTKHIIYYIGTTMYCLKYIKTKEIKSDDLTGRVTGSLRPIYLIPETLQK